jgi:beta-lactam-binding protein with PASTA domain
VRTLIVAVALLVQAMPADAQKSAGPLAQQPSAAQKQKATGAVAGKTVNLVDYPPVKNLTLAEAQKAFGALKLRCRAVRVGGGNPAPDDVVVDQTPGPGQGVFTKICTFSVQPQPVNVQVTPGVIGRPREVAIKIVSIAELKPNSSWVPSTDTALASVVAQDPPPGAPIRPDRTIDLQIAGVPQVVGLTVDAATTALERAHLVVGTPTVKELTEGNDGTVLEQNPQAGDSTSPGTSVALTVVRVVAPQPITVVVPDFTGTRIDQVSSVAGAEPLSITSRFSKPRRDAQDSIVTAQSLPAGSRVPIGTQITLTVSLRQAPRLVAIRIEPDNTSIASSDSVRLTVVGVMSDGSQIAVRPSWRVSTGSISSDGLYAATGASGRVVVIAQFAGLTTSSLIQVVPVPFPPLWLLILAITVGVAALGWGVRRFLRWRQKPPIPVPPPVFEYKLDVPGIDTRITDTHGHGLELSLASHAGETDHALELAGAQLFNEENTHG